METVLPVFNTLVLDVHARHGETGGGAEGGQVQFQGETDVLVQLLTAGHCLLEPLEVEGQDGRWTEDEELLAGRRVDGSFVPSTGVGVVLLLALCTGLTGPLQHRQIRYCTDFIQDSTSYKKGTDLIRSGEKL